MVARAAVALAAAVVITVLSALPVSGGHVATATIARGDQGPHVGKAADSAHPTRRAAGTRPARRHARPRAAFTVAAVNIRSYPLMSRRAYRHDIRRLSHIRGAKVVLGSEIQRHHGERWLWWRVWRRHGYRVIHPYRETSQAVDRRRIHVLASGTFRLHRAVAGPKSPSRWRVLTRTTVHGYRVAFLSVHLTNGCFRHNDRHWWYAARCRALAAERSRVRRTVARLHAHHWTVVVGGDVNSRHRIDWSRAPGERATRPVTLMQIAVIPARRVHARLTRFRVIRGLYTDHDAPTVHVSLRGARSARRRTLAAL